MPPGSAGSSQQLDSRVCQGDHKGPRCPREGSFRKQGARVLSQRHPRVCSWFGTTSVLRTWFGLAARQAGEVSWWCLHLDFRCFSAGDARRISRLQLHGPRLRGAGRRGNSQAEDGGAPPSLGAFGAGRGCEWDGSCSGRSLLRGGCRAKDCPISEGTGSQCNRRAESS